MMVISHSGGFENIYEGDGIFKSEQRDVSDRVPVDGIGVAASLQVKVDMRARVDSSDRLCKVLSDPGHHCLDLHVHQKAFGHGRQCQEDQEAQGSTDKQHGNEFVIRWC